VQALDARSSQLLQIPYFEDVHVELCRESSITTLSEFLAKEPEERKAITKMTGDQLLDVEVFCAHAGKRKIQATIGVDDEAEIVVGDVAAVTVRMHWQHLKKGEAQGPVSSPLFPEPKFEEWWLFLVESGTGTATSRIVHFERVTDTERCMEEKLRFQVTKAGENKLVLHAMCDAYAGLDQKFELTYKAYAEDQFQRKLPLHQEDDELDLQPTLFQTFMGDFKQDDSEEEEEDAGAEDNASAKKTQGGTSPASRKCDGVAKEGRAAEVDDDINSEGSSSGSDD